MEGFDNLATGSTIIKNKDNADVTMLGDLNLSAGESSADAPFTFTLASLSGIHKVIVYAKTDTDSVAGWKVSYFIPLLTKKSPAV